MNNAAMLPMPVRATPYEHQRAAFNFVCRKFGLMPSETYSNGVALLIEMGGGKSLVGVASTGALHQHGKVNRVLVVAPLSILGVWEQEFHEGSTCTPQQGRPCQNVGR